MGICEVKAKKGLIRVTTEVEGGLIKDISITGDFFMYPEESLWEIENSLKGIKADYDQIHKILENVFNKLNVKLVGASVEDFVSAVWCSINGS